MTRRIVALVLLLPTLVLAQPGPGEIGIYADPNGTVGAFTVTPFAPYTLYVLAGPGAGIDSYQFQINGLLETGSVILETTVSGVNQDSLEPNQFVVEASSCLTGDLVVLAEILVISLGAPAADTAICLRSLEGDGGPEFVDCNGELQDFGFAQRGEPRFPDGCLFFNLTQDLCCYSNIYELGMPELLAQVGDFRRVPLVSDVSQDWTCIPGAIPRTSCVPGEAYRIRRSDLVFDPTLLRLVGAELGEDVVGWTLTLTEVEPGRVTVDARSPEQQDPWPDLDFGAHIWFEFEVLAAGTAQIVFGPDSTNPVYGAITQDPVSGDATSFGALKARFE